MQNNNLNITFMGFTISDLRTIINRFGSFNPSDCLTDKEIDSFHQLGDDEKSHGILVDGVLINQFRVSNVQYAYDSLSTYIKLLQELYSHRPLTF